MKTVAFVTTRFVRQGPNKQLLYLIRNIDREKIKPIIITLSPEKGPTLIKEFKEENIEIIQLNLGMIQSLYKAKGIIKKIIINKDISIVHSFTYATRVEFIIYKLKNIIKLASVRNSPKSGSISYNGRILGSILYLLKMHMYKHFDRIIACSKSIGGLPEFKSLDKDIIQNGIDTSILSSSYLLVDKMGEKNKLNLPKDKKIFLTISNGTRLKNIGFLIDFFKTQTEKYLVIAGDITEDYIKLSSNSKNINLIGHVDNIYDFYLAADFFISASFLEGLPNAVLEALLVGTPCILSDIPMHREIFEQSNNYIGQLFKNKDKVDLLKNIKILESQIDSNTSKKCSQFVINNFSAVSMTKQYENLYYSFLFT